MEINLTKITPALARQWLERNTNNRHLAPSVVASLVGAFSRGEYRITHQGIAFDVDGVLLDGQHRLTAIAQMPPDFHVNMFVAKNVPREAFKAIDIGKTRSHADVLHVPQRLAAVGRLIAVINETAKLGITPQLLIPIIAGIREEYEELVGYCPRVTKTWSSAAIMTAAILRLLNDGDRDHILLSYHALNHSEFDSMVPVMQNLYRQQVRGTGAKSGVIDLCARAYVAFDWRRRSINKIQIKDSSSFLAEAREIVRTRIMPEMKKPTAVAVGKKVSGANSTWRARV